MPTVIDSLVISLGLDSAEFKGRIGEIEGMLGRARDTTDRQAKEISASGLKIAEGFRTARNEAIALFAVITGGYGLVEFIGHTITANANLGRMATNINMSTKELYSFREAVRQLGGDADATQATLANITSEAEALKQTGHSQLQNTLRGIGIGLLDENGNAVDPAKIMDQLHAWGMAQKDRLGAFAYFTGRLGFDQGTANLLLDPNYQQRLAGTAANAPDAAAVERAQKYQEAWSKFRTDIEAMARNSFLDTFGSDLDKLEPQIKSFMTDVKELVEAVGGIGHAFEIMLAIWAAPSVIAIVSGITSVTRAILTLRAAAVVGLTGPAAIGGVAALAALSAYLGFRIPGLDGGAAEEKDMQKNNEQLSDGSNLTGSAIEYFMSAEGGGWSRDQAAGFVAQIASEDPTWDPSKTNESGHTGLFQTSQERQRVLEAHFPSWGPYRTWTRQQQLAGWNWEYSPGGPEATVGAEYRGVTGGYNAGFFVSHNMERHGIAAEDVARGQRADRLSHIPLPPPTLPPPNIPGFGLGALGGTTNSAVTIGNITVNTQASDATGIARDIRGALQRQAFIASANTGLV